MTTYDLYKPLRNSLRRYPLIDSLFVVWAYLQRLQFDRPFPKGMESPSPLLLARKPNTFLHEWELSLLAKELIINAPEKGSHSLRKYDELRHTLNRIKSIENEITGRYPQIGEDILLEVYRIAHRTFPWQTPPSMRSFVRYFKIFSSDGLAQIFTRKLGMAPSELYTLGLTLGGHFLNSFILKLPIESKSIGISGDLADRFVRLFSADMGSLRTAALKLQSHDHDYAYTLNPLQFSPLIMGESEGKPALIAPVAHYLLKRFTDGVFYDLCNEPGFGDYFGPAFQSYVGEVLLASAAGSTLQVLAEQQFQAGKSRKDSTDWIVSDPSGHIFVECKAKRLRADAKVLFASTATLDSELGKIADAVAQTYKAIADAEQGLYPHWKPDGKPIYPLVVTLEDWYAWGRRILDPITSKVQQRLEAAGLSSELVERYPFNICAVSELEEAAQVIAAVGVDRFMSSKMEGEAKDWAIAVHTRNSFYAEAKAAKPMLFPEDLKRINPILGTA